MGVHGGPSFAASSKIPSIETRRHGRAHGEGDREAAAGKYEASVALVCGARCELRAYTWWWHGAQAGAPMYPAVSRHARRATPACARARPAGPVPAHHRAAGRHRPLALYTTTGRTANRVSPAPPYRRRAQCTYLATSTCVRARLWSGPAQRQRAAEPAGGSSTRGQRRGALGSIQPRIQRRRTVDDCDCMFSLS